MSKEIELPKSHIRDLLRNNHDVLIGSDAIASVNELVQNLKTQINAEIHKIMQNEGRTIIKKDQILKAIENKASTDNRSNQLNLNNSESKEKND